MDAICSRYMNRINVRPLKIFQGWFTHKILAKVPRALKSDVLFDIENDFMRVSPRSGDGSFRPVPKFWASCLGLTFLCLR